MIIKTLASSSAGCCYIIESGGERLLIECGISLKKIREALNFDLSNIVGCLVSHEHKDHCKTTPQLIKKTAIKLYTPKSCVSYGLMPEICLSYGLTFGCGKMFSVKAIRLFHDVDCLGYIIATEGAILFYATDTGKIPYTIPGITHLMIEANYDLEILINSKDDKAYRNRTADNHLNIDQAIEFAERHKKTLKEVHLLHLSDRHSDEDAFLKKAEERLGIPVYIAKK